MDKKDPAMRSDVVRMKVLCPVSKQGKINWVRVGVAYVNADDSINVYLEAFPANGKLMLRPYNG